MPLYDFECEKCEEVFEGAAKIADRNDVVCITCGGETKCLTGGQIKREEATWYKDLDGVLNDKELSRQGKMKKIETRSDYRDYVNHLYKGNNPRVRELRKRYLSRASFD